MASWAQRSTAAGVLHAVAFTGPDDLGKVATIPTVGPWLDAGEASTPYIDPNEGCSGPGALRFDLPSGTGANPSGSWQIRFSQRFGVNSQFYCQVRIKWNSVMMDTAFLQYDGIRQGGIKFFDVCDYRQSSSPTKAVVQTNVLPYRFPLMYGYGPGGATKGYSSYPAGAEIYQPGLDDGSVNFCRFNYGVGYNTNACHWMVADQWVTFKLWIQNLTRRVEDTRYWDQRLKLWMQYGGDPSTLLIDYNENTPGYVPRDAGAVADDYVIDRLTVFPYMTDKAPWQSHDAGIVWADEVIVSTQDIADADAPVGSGVVQATQKARAKSRGLRAGRCR